MSARANTVPSAWRLGSAKPGQLASVRCASRRQRREPVVERRVENVLGDKRRWARLGIDVAPAPNLHSPPREACWYQTQPLTLAARAEAISGRPAQCGDGLVRPNSVEFSQEYVLVLLPCAWGAAEVYGQSKRGHLRALPDAHVLRRVILQWVEEVQRVVVVDPPIQQALTTPR